MKGYLLCALAVTPFFGMLAQQPAAYRDFVAPDAEQMDLRGKVKTLREIYYDTKQRISNEKLYSFDLQGYFLEAISLDHKSRTKSTIRYVYDGLGNLSEEIEVKDSGTSIRKVRIFPESKRLEKSVMESNRLVKEEESKYDVYKKEAEVIGYKKDGQVDNVYKARRNEGGKEVEVTFSDASGKLTTILVMRWNLRGFIIGETWDRIDEKDIIEKIITYPTIDENGNWTEQRTAAKLLTNGREDITWQTLATRSLEYY